MSRITNSPTYLNIAALTIYVYINKYLYTHTYKFTSIQVYVYIYPLYTQRHVWIQAQQTHPSNTIHPHLSSGCPLHNININIVRNYTHVLTPDETYIHTLSYGKGMRPHVKRTSYISWLVQG